MSADHDDTAAERLDRAAQGRRALKHEAQALDREGEDAKRGLIAEAGRRGVPLPEEAALWPGKRLLRRAMGRESEARQRQNPIRRDEGFTCASCGAEVPPGGARVRDHCPRCLRSLHLDVVPGDRAAGCGGIMDPVSIEITGGEARLSLRCRRCGARARVRAHEGDDPKALAQLSAAADPWGA